MSPSLRSHCPISFALDSFGDKWSLLILRDLLFRGKTYYDEFLQSPEGISTNILADRLKKLESERFIKKTQDPENKRRFIYQPDSKALDLIPMMLEMVQWSAQYDSKTIIPPSEIKKIKKDPKAYAKRIRSERSRS